MKAEIIIIGDEILYGQTVDTNSAFIAEKLGELGIEISYKTSVADDVKTIVEAIHLAQSRVNLKQFHYRFYIYFPGVHVQHIDMGKNKRAVKQDKNSFVFFH